MSRKPFIYTLLVFLTLVLFSTFDASAGVSASTIVVPNASESVEGDGGTIFPFNCGFSNDESLRYQQLYSSSEFGSKSCFITEIRFRKDTTSFNFDTEIEDIMIQLSTSSKNVTNMSNMFADNIGSDIKTVYEGDLPFFTNCGFVLCPFDIVIPLQQGFLYDPSQGALLFDARIPTCPPSFTTLFDADFNSDVVSSAYTASFINAGTLGVNATEADSVNLAEENDGSIDGLVTQFVCGEPPHSGPVVIIPTLSQWGMMLATILMGLFAVVALRRRTES